MQLRVSVLDRTRKSGNLGTWTRVISLSLSLSLSLSRPRPRSCCFVKVAAGKRAPKHAGLHDWLATGSRPQAAPKRGISDDGPGECTVSATSHKNGATVTTSPGLHHLHAHSQTTNHEHEHDIRHGHAQQHASELMWTCRVESTCPSTLHALGTYPLPLDDARELPIRYRTTGKQHCHPHLQSSLQDDMICVMCSTQEKGPSCQPAYMLCFLPFTTSHNQPRHL